MKAGEIINYKGVTYKVESEKSEFSCNGCDIRHVVRDNNGKPIRDRFGNLMLQGCGASMADKIFATCKHDHVIFVKA